MLSKGDNMTHALASEIARVSEIIGYLKRAHKMNPSDVIKGSVDQLSEDVQNAVKALGSGELLDVLKTYKVLQRYNIDYVDIT